MTAVAVLGRTVSNRNFCPNLNRAKQNLMSRHVWLTPNVLNYVSISADNNPTDWISECFLKDYHPLHTQQTPLNCLSDKLKKRKFCAIVLSYYLADADSANKEKCRSWLAVRCTVRL